MQTKFCRLFLCLWNEKQSLLVMTG